ncbi:MAG: uroporphyrinogen decarboxylase [Alphaproteobacteria bacterium]|nr:uroporphyrinogen decarboxylase [Alphaproteobacteria bacterium]
MNKSRKPILDVLGGQIPERVPVWLMRQAGRYLPEYRELRAKSKNFLNMCLTPDLATEITLQPIRRFDMDAAILFADILLVPMALGVDLQFREGEGPALQPVSSMLDLEALFYDPASVAPVMQTIRQVAGQLSPSTTLIGFCGAPWTVACYMIDGNSHSNFAATKKCVYENPEFLERLIAILIDASEQYLSAQIEAGAEALQIFDSWAGLLSGEAFTHYVINPTRILISRLKKKYPHIPIIGFPREAADGYEPYIKQTGIDALGIDQSVDLAYAKRALQSVKPLQGNLSPDLLVQGGAAMLDAAATILRTFGPLHIFNLGHGVVPQTPPEHVAQLVAYIREFRP